MWLSHKKTHTNHITKRVDFETSRRGLWILETGFFVFQSRNYNSPTYFLDWWTNKNWSFQHTFKGFSSYKILLIIPWSLKHYHSVTCLALELGRNGLFPDMLGLSSATVTTPISIIVYEISFKISAFWENKKREILKNTMPRAGVLAEAWLPTHSMWEAEKKEE